MYKEFLNKIKNKYNYDEDLMKAIELCIPVMVDTYGEKYIEDILNLFDNVRIFATSDMSKQNREKIEKEMIGSNNPNIEYIENNPYDNDLDPGSYYSYESVYDENMNAVSEIRWIVADKINKYREEGYKNLFGTNINMPYFLHELNHAFAMQNSISKTEGNTITEKHGMYTTKKVFSSNDGKIEIKPLSDEDIILEEMINEMYTQHQLMKMLGKDNYDEVKKELDKIGHVSTSYSVILISIAEQLSELLGKDKLMEYRLNNDSSVKDEFNLFSSKSEISKKYIDGLTPYEYLSKKCYEIFQLTCNRYRISIDEYREKQRNLMIEAFIPLSAYKDIKYGTINLEKFESIKESIISPKEELKKR